MREQRTATEAADREQRRVGRLADARAKDVHDDMLDRLRAHARQRARIGTVAECVGEATLVVAEQLLEREPRFGRYAAARHRRRQARRFGEARSVFDARHAKGLMPLAARASGSRRRRR